MIIDFGAALKTFRDERGFSLRELATLSEVDHAYIHRLESGDKSAPSDDVLDKLTRGLKLAPHKRKLLELLTQVTAVDALLFDLALDQPQRVEAVKAAAKMSFRGARPTTKEEWQQKLDLIESLMGT